MNPCQTARGIFTTLRLGNMRIVQRTSTPAPNPLICEHPVSYRKENYYGPYLDCRLCPVGRISAEFTIQKFQCFNPSVKTCGVNEYGYNGKCDSCPPGTASLAFDAVRLCPI